MILKDFINDPFYFNNQAVINYNGIVDFNNKKWILQTDIHNNTPAQWGRLNELLSLKDNASNIHKLIALFFRPCKKSFIKYKILDFDLNTQDDLSNELLNLDISIAYGILLKINTLILELTQLNNVKYINQLNREYNELLDDIEKENYTKWL